MFLQLVWQPKRVGLYLTILKFFIGKVAFKFAESEYEVL